MVVLLWYWKNELNILHVRFTILKCTRNFMARRRTMVQDFVHTHFVRMVGSNVVNILNATAILNRKF